MVLRHPQRVPLLSMGMVALLAGLWAGLLRLGVDPPQRHPTLPAAHGPLMVSGFLGALISLERAVALGKCWAYAAPLLSGAGGLVLIADLPYAVAFGGVPAGPPYDAMLHAFFLGFVFAMIFGHAPIIFPAVLGAKMTFRPLFYAHVVLLQATLVLRLAGDVAGWWPGRQVGGLLNAVALLLFLVNTAASLVKQAEDDAPVNTRRA